MGSELLTEEEQTNEGDSDNSESPFVIAQYIEDCFPYYLSLGMSYDEYWYGDPTMVVAYRKAEDMRTHRRNWEMWMNGRYTYDAIASMIPSLQIIKPREPLPYTKEPYPLTKKEYEERMEREEKKKQEEIMAKMMAFAKTRSSKKVKEEEKQNG